MAQQLYNNETDETLFILQPLLFTKNLESLFNNVLGQYGLICDNVGWWSGFNKCGDRIYDIDMGLSEIVEFMGSNNQFVPDHGALIGSTVIVVDGGGIP